MASQFVDMTSLSNFFFDVVLFLLSSLVSAVMDSFFYKGLTRNPRIRNTPV